MNKSLPNLIPTMSMETLRRTTTKSNPFNNNSERRKNGRLIRKNVDWVN